MGDFSKHICQLCLDKTPADECESIDQIKKEMLETLLIKINFDLSDYAVACNGCQQKLQNTFDFKSRCIGTFLAPDSKANVENVILPSELKNNNETVCLKNYQECRLCMSLIENKDFSYITDLGTGVPLKDMIRNCFPEMDLSIVHEPLICKPCVSGLKRYYDFMESCHKAEHLANDTVAMELICSHKIVGTLKPIDGDEPGKPVLIKRECPDADSEVTAMPCPEPEYNESIKYEEVHIKDELDIGQRSINNERKFDCCYCNYNTKYKHHLNRHISAIHGKETGRAHHCEHCNFQTTYTRSLHRHQKIHLENALYKCLCCEKAFDRRGELDNHMLKKHDNFQHLITSKIHCCTSCGFKSTRISNLKSHMVHNHDREKAEKFQCQVCDYFALRKGDLARHLLVHSTLRPYLCTLCKRGFNQKLQLDCHILTSHEENADLLKNISRKMYQCTLCKYKTVYPSHLRSHIKINHK